MQSNMYIVRQPRRELRYALHAPCMCMQSASAMLRLLCVAETCQCFNDHDLAYELRIHVDAEMMHDYDMREMYGVEC